jgi:hypothetical protein
VRFDAAMMLASGPPSSGVLAAFGFAALLTVIPAAVGVWKPELRQSYFLFRLVGWGLLVFVLSLFGYGVLHLSNSAALGLLGATLTVCAALDWANRRRNRS